MNTSKRIAKNTLMLYFRQILIMLVSLYTVRVVLNVLGAEDYGIYNVVAGVVTMFSFLSGAMASSSQRFFSYDIGKKDSAHLKTTFSVTFQIYLVIALAVVLLHSSQARIIWDIIAKGLRVKQVSLDCVVKNNRSVAFSPIMPKQRAVFCSDLSSESFSFMVRKYGVTHIWTKAVRFAKRCARYILRITIHKDEGVGYNLLCEPRTCKAAFVSKLRYRNTFLYKNSTWQNAGGVFLFNSRNLRIS